MTKIDRSKTSGATRRTILKSAAVGGALATMGPFVHGARAQASKRVVFATWGGSWKTNYKS